MTESTTDSVVTPWKVEGTIDYSRLVEQFGTELITLDDIKRIEKLTGKKAHPWLYRKHFFSHRALNSFLDAYERGDPVFLYTGRGPTSESLHLGHTIPFTFTVWLQQAFDCPVVIQMADDEKYAFKDMAFETIYKLGFENAKDVVAFGFDPKKTFIFSNRDYRLYTPEYEVFVSDMKTKVNAKEVASIFGFDKDSSSLATVAMYDWPFYQSAAAFSQAFPHIFGKTKAHCLVAYAIDQDPYFRMARDLASKMSLIKPYSIMCQFIPPLTGTKGKMSSSVGADASVFLTDNKETIRRKIMTYAFSGGGGDGSLEDHKKYGGNVDEDISYQYLTYFEYDDEVLKDIHDRFKTGSMSCSEIKNILVTKVTELIVKHQENRAKVTNDVLKHFYEKHAMDTTGKTVKVTLTFAEEKLYSKLSELGIEYKTKYHKVIESVEEGKELATTLTGTACKTLFMVGDSDNYYLVVTGFDQTVDTKTLSKTLNHKKLKFVDGVTISDVLKVPVGCVTPFAIMNLDEEQLKSVKLVLEPSVLRSSHLNFYPLRNDATTTVSYSDMLKFVSYFDVKILN